MYIIGLTGGIATGKSTAAQALRSFGADVIDADAISRAATMPGGSAAPAVLEAFGTLDRKAIAGKVFADPEARRRLEAIVHPIVRAEMARRIGESRAPVCVLDVPLLFESGMETMADEVWVTWVPGDEQLRRVRVRDGLDEDAARARIASQMPTEEKIRRADHAVDTSGSFENTRACLRRLWEQALERAGESG